MKKMNVLVCLCLLALFPGTVRADAAVVIPEDGLNPDRLDHPLGLPLPFDSWRFHRGDRAEWADPAFDDSSWRTMDSLLAPDVLSRIDWTGNGWFRLHLRVDPTLWDRPLALVYFQTGAAEIYLDGRLIASFGRVGDSRETEEVPSLSGGIPEIIPIRFSRQADHVVAVRYSNFWGVAHQNPAFPGDFPMALSELDHGVNQKAVEIREITMYQMFFSGVALAFALLHLLLFLCYPESRENLYYAIFAGSISGMSFVPLQMYAFPADPGRFFVLLWASKASVILAAVSGLWFLYHVFLGAPPRFLKIPFAIGILLLPVAWYIPLTYVYAIIPATCPEMLRVVFVAFRRKKDGVRTIGVGCVILALTYIYQFLLELRFLERDYVDFPYLYGILALAISMSIYLARSFARTNRNLEAQFVQVRDLSTHLERANRQLEDYSRTLEQKVEERTREVSEKNSELEETLHQLRETQSQLVVQEKMASLGNLVAGVAHEMNTPVGAMNSMHDTLIRAVDRLKETLGTTFPREYKDTRAIHSLFGVIADANRVIARGAERVTAIVRSLRNFARLDEAEFQMVDIHEGIESTLTLLQARIGEDIVVVRDYGDLEPLYCSPGRLNQVFMGLLKHAVQSIEGRGEIGIRTSRDDRKVYIRIGDTGAGISPEHLEHIFEFGFRAAGSRVEMGFGLSTEYNIIQEHKGEIQIESEVGKGTEVTVSLPVDLDETLKD